MPWRANTFFDGRRELIAELNSQRQTGEFLDVVVKVQNMRFRCHRAILSSTKYFKAILSSIRAKGGSSEVIELQNVAPLCFPKILDFVYTGEITISKDDVKDILQTAHTLKFKKITKHCKEFMRDTLCLSNCLLYMHLANLYGFSTLKVEARAGAVAHFSKVKQTDGFLALSSDELVDLLGDNMLQVTSEDEVVTSVIRWLDHDPESRKLALPAILQEIRLTCVRVSVLVELESHPAVQESAECLAKVTAAKEEHLTGTRQLGAGAGGVGAIPVPKRRLATSDDLTIIVGGWKAIARYRDGPINDPDQPIPLQSIICLDPDDRLCYHITNLPTPTLGYMSVANTGRQLYVTGGRVSPMTGHGPHTAPLKQAFCYDVPTDTWKKLPDMPRGRAGHQSVVVDGKLFLVGGDVEAEFDEAASTEATCPFSIDCCDLEKGTWIKLPTVPPIDTQSNTKVAACGGKLILIERLMKRYRRTLCVHALDVTDNQWVHSDITTWGNYGYSSSGRIDMIDVDISVDSTDDQLYFRAGTLFAYDVKTESLTMVKSKPASWSVKFLRTELKNTTKLDRYLLDLYVNHDVPEDTMDAIISIHESAETAEKGKSDDAKLKLKLPFAVFGYSVLGTLKSSVGWYCRDRLAKLNDEQNHNDHFRVCNRRWRGLPMPHFENDNHTRDLGVELLHQSKTGTYTDVVLQVEDGMVRCHRAVLASTPYFKTMFSSSLKESNSRVVNLREIHCTNLLKILAFLYTGSIHIRKDNVQDILQAAHMMQIDQITEFCRRVIQRNLHPCNCIGVMHLANLYGFSDLEKRAMRKATTKFSEVRQNEEFLSLSTDELVNLLGGHYSRLQVTSEDEVVTSVLRWLDHDPERRQTAMPAILQEICLSDVKVSALEKLESHPMVRESAECLAKITAVKEGHLTGTQQVLNYEHKRSGTRSDDLEIIVGGWREPHYQHSAQAMLLESIICRDPDNEQFYHVTKLPTCVCGYMSVVYISAERRLYVTGGRDHPLLGQQGPHSAPSRQAFQYEFPTDTWTRLPDMPRGRAGHQSVVVDGKLFLVGGDVEATSVSCVDCYDLKEEAWIRPPTLPEIDPSSKLTLIDTSWDPHHVVLFETRMVTKECAMEDALRQVLGRNLKAERRKLVVHVYKVALSFTDDDDLATTASDSDTDDDDVWDDDEEEVVEENEYEKDEEWTCSDILVLLNVDGHDIFVIAVNDKVYFHFVPDRKLVETSDRYINRVKVYSVKEKTVTNVRTVFSFSRAKRGYRRYYYVFDRFSDEIINHKFKDLSSREEDSEAPTSLFGQSILTTYKSSIGWYCRDLAKLENGDEPNQTA